jgi:hypothetical protein
LPGSCIGVACSSWAGKIKANRKEAKDLAEPMKHDRHGARGHYAGAVVRKGLTVLIATVIKYFGSHSCLGGNDVPQPSHRIPGRRISRSASGAADRVRACHSARLLGVGAGSEKS